MKTTFQKVLFIILISLGLAFIFNFLFFSKLIGISVAIFTFSLLAATFLFGLKDPQVSLLKNWWLVLLIMFFALMPAIRANEFLTFLNVVATFGLLMLLAYQLVDTPVWLMKIHDYLVLAIVVPFRMLGGALGSLSTLGQVHSNIKNREILLRILKGLFMAIPVLFVFITLFSHADLAFSQFINSIIEINISPESIRYTVLLIFAFLASLSFLSYIFSPKQFQTDTFSANTIQPADKGIEILVFLGLIATLFLVFIIFQITYLFGGETNIINAGFTYAEYARRGFFELLFVAVLSLLVLLYAEKHAGIAIKKPTFLIPALILIVEVGVVMVAAFKRLSLYIDVYGMTLLRFYVNAFIILLLILFVILAIKFIKSKPEHFFTFGTLLSVAAFLAIVNLVNPDAYITRTNIEQYSRTNKLDIIYLDDLSVDATAEKIELYNKLNGEEKALLQEILLNDQQQLQKNNIDWQAANFSRYQALELLKGFAE